MYIIHTQRVWGFTLGHAALRMRQGESATLIRRRHWAGLKLKPILPIVGYQCPLFKLSPKWSALYGE